MVLCTNPPLRYKISDWRQLKGCLSNNSKHLHISTKTYLNNKHLNGLNISVEDDRYGILFSYCIGLTGDIITEYSSITDKFSKDLILTELKRFGFLVEFVQEEHISGSLLDLLMTLSHLNYDKLRLMNHYHYNQDTQKEFVTDAVLFNTEHLVDWINPGYACTDSEFDEAIKSGWALSITNITKRDKKHYDWTWLYNKVMNIDDLLEANSIHHYDGGLS